MSNGSKYGKRAAALTYSGVGAPVLVAKGEGDYADLIVEAGKEAEIPIVKGDELSSYLQKVATGRRSLRNFLSQWLSFYPGYTGCKVKNLQGNKLIITSKRYVTHRSIFI